MESGSQQKCKCCAVDLAFPTKNSTAIFKCPILSRDLLEPLFFASDETGDRCCTSQYGSRNISMLQSLKEENSLRNPKSVFLKYVGWGKSIKDGSSRCNAQNHPNVPHRCQYSRRDAKVRFWCASHHSAGIWGLENSCAKAE